MHLKQDSNQFIEIVEVFTEVFIIHIFKSTTLIHLIEFFDN